MTFAYRKILGLIFCAACAVFSANAQALNKGGLGELLPAGSAPATAQVVEVGFFPVAVHSIDESTSTYNIDFYMWMRWKGERDPTEHVTFMNSVNKWGMTKNLLYKSPVTLEDGTQYQFMRVEGTFQETFSLATFPLDRHRLTIKIEDDELDASKIVYVLDREDSGYSNHLTMPGWDIVGWDHKASIFNYGTVMGERSAARKVSPHYSLLSFELVIARPPGFFAWKLMLPLLVVLLSGLIALMVNPADASTRIFMPSTALLTLVFLQQSYSSTLPSVSGLVLLDRIYVMAYLLTLVSLGWIIKAARMMDNSEGAAAPTIQRYDRYILLLNTVVFVLTAAALIALH
jgi:hypothetical protein